MLPRTVVGIDPSFTSTGIAILTDKQAPELVTIKSSGHRADSYGTRSARTTKIADGVLAHVRPTDALVIIEGPALRANDPGVWDRAGLWRDLYRRISELGVPVGVCAPKTRAKWATGNGNADKKAVRAGVQKLWPDVVIRNPDVADGLVLGTMAAQLEYMDVPWRPWHKECLGKVALEVAA